MGINEIFSNPTVKQVIFEIRFPNLFYIENKIGDIQIKIMNRFPESALVYKKQFILADVGPEGKLQEIQSNLEQESSSRIWQFKNDKNVQINITNNSLDINSKYHKTYNLEGGTEKFRDTIEFVLDNFLETTSIPIINRIGLRYIDECPIIEKSNETFLSYYNSVFPLDRFDLSLSEEMHFKAVVKKGEHFLRYLETIKKEKDKYFLILDFDGYGEKIKPQEYLKVADILHSIISDEFELSIKEPLKEFMRNKKEK